jgi:hypothetical protein
MQKDLDNLNGDLDALAEMYSKSKSWVVMRLSLVNLPPTTARLVKEKITSDVRVIYDVKAIEKKDAEAATEVVDRLADAPVDSNAREIVGVVKSRVMLEAKKLQAKKATKKPVKIVPAKMPKATKKTQPMHTFYTNAITRGMRGQDALELMDPDSRCVVLGLLDDTFNRVRASEDGPAEMLRMLREGWLAGAGAALMPAALAGLNPDHDLTPEELAARIGEGG